MINFRQILLDYLFALAIVLVVLLSTALDDSYEDQQLSADVLKEAIAQSHIDRNILEREFVAHQTISGDANEKRPNFNN